MKTKIAILGIALCLLNVAADRPPAQCPADMLDALVGRHTIHPQPCSTKDETFVFVGSTSGGKFSVYDYRYRYQPHPGGIYHGGQRIIVFRGKRYVGQYGVISSYYAVHVRGTDVILQSEDSDEKVRLDFSRNPPGEVLLDGEPIGFFR